MSRFRRCVVIAVLALAASYLVMSRVHARANDVSRQVLAFYYGWYGNPSTSGHWVHWSGVNPASKRIADSADYPTLGAYDSHNPEVIDRQAAMARAAGITGFIASWWGRGSFEDRGMPLLLAAAAKHGLVVSAYYEKIAGPDRASRVQAAIADLDYLLARYAQDKTWLRAAGQPVVFVYGRATHDLTPADWQEVLARVRRDNPGGLRLIADSWERAYDAVFDGASEYNVTGEIKGKSPAQLRIWAHNNYPRMVALAGPGKISTVTVIPGYDDRVMKRPGPRPITERWDGETYRILWQAAIAAAPNYILITSWNEWHEGSEIEPSVQYGSRFINETATFSQEFLAGKR